MDICSFCGRKECDTTLLIKSTSSSICDFCIENCNKIVIDYMRKLVTTSKVESDYIGLCGIQNQEDRKPNKKCKNCKELCDNN